MSNIIHLPGNINHTQVDGLTDIISNIDESISGVNNVINEREDPIITSLYNLNNNIKAIERIKDNLNNGVLINKSLTEAAAIKDSIINDDTIEYNWQNNCYPNNTNLTITTTTSGRCTWTKTLLPKGTKIYYNSKNAGSTASSLRLAYSINSPEEYYTSHSNTLIGFIFNKNIYHQTSITNSGVYIMPEDGYFIYFQSQTHEPILQIDTNVNRKPNTIYFTTDKHSIVVNGIAYSTEDFSGSSFVYADESFSASSAWDTTKIYITPSNITGKFDLYYHNGTNWIKFGDTTMHIDLAASNISYSPSGTVQSAIENMHTKIETIWNEDRLEFIKNNYPITYVSYHYGLSSVATKYSYTMTNNTITSDTTSGWRMYWTNNKVPKGTLIHITITYTTGHAHAWLIAKNSPQDYYASNSSSLVGFEFNDRIYHSNGKKVYNEWFEVPYDGYLIYRYCTSNVSSGLGLSVQYYDANIAKEVYTNLYNNLDFQAPDMASIVGLGYNLFDYKYDNSEIDLDGFAINVNRQRKYNYNLLYYWDSDDDLVGNVWYDRIKNSGWSATNPLKDNGMYKVGQDGSTERSFYMNLNTGLVLPARHRVEVEFKYQITNDLACYIIDFGSLGQASHAFSFTVLKTHKLTSNHKVNGNSSSGTYGIPDADRIVVPENKLIKCVIGTTKYDSSNVILYSEYNDKNAYGALQYSNTISTFNNNWDMNNGYIGRGYSANTYWRGLMWIKSIKIYQEVDK